MKFDLIFQFYFIKVKMEPSPSFALKSKFSSHLDSLDVYKLDRIFKGTSFGADSPSGSIDSGVYDDEG